MSTLKSRWEGFLSSKRIGEDHSSDYDNFRSPYQRDKDAIVFSSHFRDLQGKTQVFSLTTNNVRNRLTHSMEVASVGRNLAEIVGRQLIERHGLENITAQDFGVILEAACLAHDIGHPPLAHAGEQAFSEYFSKNELRFKKKVGIAYNDFLHFEGNAKNMRILCDLEQPSRQGGMRLTSAVLGAISKYPRLSHGQIGNKKEVKSWCSKKFNFFKQDKAVLLSLAENLGLEATGNPDEYHRSPLAYLVEASDDICYGLIDIEDALTMKVIDYSDAVELLSPITDDTINRGELTKVEHIRRLRAKAIGKLLYEVADIFLTNEEDIINGQFKGDLLDHVSVATEFKKLKTFAAKNIYVSDVALDIRTAGYNIIEKLLELLVDSAMDVFENGDHASSKSEAYLLTLKEPMRSRVLEAKTHYDVLINITDHISSMTDNEAVATYKNFLGASIQTL